MSVQCNRMTIDGSPCERTVSSPGGDCGVDHQAPGPSPAAAAASPDAVASSAPLASLDEVPGEPTPAPRMCIACLALAAAPGDVYCEGCGSATDRTAWTGRDPDDDDLRVHSRESLEAETYGLAEELEGLYKDRRNAWAEVVAANEYDARDDSLTSLEIDGKKRFVLVERSRYDGSFYCTDHSSKEDAASYHDNQESADDWTILALHDLDTGEVCEGETHTTFVAPLLSQDASTH